MAGLTLTLARTQVLDYVDDPNGRRYNVAGDFAKVDRALQAALTSCVSDYVAAGGDALDEETSVTTSSTGLATLSVLIRLLRGVQVDTGDAFFSIPKVQRRDRTMLEQAVRTLRVEFVRDYQLGTSGQPLVGVGATQGASWRSLEDWICAEAALRLAVIDDNLRGALRELAAKDRASVLGELADADGSGLPNGDVEECALWYGDMGFVYTPSPSAPTIQVVNQRGGR